MSSVKRIVIQTNCSKKPNNFEEVLGILVEIAPENIVGNKCTVTIPLKQLIGDLESTKRSACELAIKLTSGEPCFKGVLQLTIFQEDVCVEFCKIFHLLHLHNYLVAQGFKICEFISNSWWGTELKKLIILLNSPLQVKIPSDHKQSRISRVLQRIFSSRFSFRTLYTEFKYLLDRIDPFHRRSMWLRKFRRRGYEQNKIWFYSTAVNYTNIGLHYESWFPESFHFLVENSLTGGAPLIKHQRRFASLYDFVLPKFIPTHDEIQQASQAISQHILNVSLNEPYETQARAMFLNGQFFSKFLSWHLPRGLFESALFEHWINVVKPSAVVVGNQICEGYALFKARKKKIPTILLQHGVLADYFPYVDHPVDYYIVRGQFFYERLSLASKKRALILNPPKNFITQAHIEKDTIVFITGPLYNRSPPLDADIKSILQVLIETIAVLSEKLVIRVHPLERIVDYQNLVGYLTKNMTNRPIVSYSQGGSLDTLLVTAKAVVLFGSTVFLDCLQHRVPMISVDWINYGLKDSLKKNNVFYFAKNLFEFRQRVIEACLGKLVPEGVETLFLANLKMENIRKTISDLF